MNYRVYTFDNMGRRQDIGEIAAETAAAAKSLAAAKLMGKFISDENNTPDVRGLHARRAGN